MDLRPHQSRAIAALRASLMAGKRRPLIQAPTGAGKTMIAAAVVQGALAKGNRVLFVVPALSLVDQTVDAFWSVGIRDVGVIQGQHEMTNPGRRVQVASVQTLQRRDIPLTEIVVIDECHRWFDFYGRWMAKPEWKSVPFVGLSATPWTKGLGKFFDDLIVAATTQELIDGGYLAPFRVFAPSHPDLAGVRIVAGDFHEGDLGEAMDKPRLVADVVDTWRQLGGDRPTLCFAVNRAHARSLQRQFEAAGIGCGYVDAFTPVEEREAVRKRLDAGEIRIVCNVGCLTTGVDWDVRCIILARPTRSEMLYTQIIGRGLRTAAGKADCVVLDHSDTTLRLGFVTDIHHDKLDDGKPRKAADGDKEDRTPLPKECPACSFLKPARVHACPSCGFTPEKQFSCDTLDGELKELRGKKKPATAEEKRRFFGELTHIAMDRGYSRGWASHKFKERFGVWPRDLGAPRFEPSPETLSWVKSRQIAFAKRKKAA